MNAILLLRRSVLGLAFCGLLAGTAPLRAQDATSQDIKQDKKDIRQDKKDLAKDRADRNADQKDINHDKRDLAKDRADRNADQRDINKDKRDLTADRKDRNQDQKDINKDKRDLHKDRKDLRHDRHGKHLRLIGGDPTQGCREAYQFALGRPQTRAAEFAEAKQGIAILQEVLAS